MADYNSKYSGEQVEALLDQVASGNAGGGGGGGIAVETDPIFSASPAATITEDDIFGWRNLGNDFSLLDGDVAELTHKVEDKQDVISDLETIRDGASKGATALQAKDVADFVTAEDLASVATSGSYNDLVDKPTFKTINNESIEGSGNITISGGSGGGTITEVKANGTSVATSGVANIPAATISVYGVTKLTSSTSSSSTTLAATASAVKAAYDLANGKASMSDVNTAIANAITNVINASY